MKRKQGPILTAILVDYDNIYLALRRKSEDAAKKFAKDAHLWLKEIESGGLITPTNSLFSNGPRRIVLNRCYGNPVPRRNTHDNSTDMNSFPFVRHHFLRAGFEVIDCPPLTSQLKNSSDIRMVMDVRDLLMHDTYFDEFIIMSGDADFTPVLHRLRAHARRTVIYANDHTAVPYTAICDGELRESELIGLLMEGGRIAAAPEPAAVVSPVLRTEDLRQAILDEALAAVRASSHPIVVDVLADRVVRQLGHDNTVGTGWAGAGGFHQLLVLSQPDGIRVGEQPPYYVFDVRRQLAEQARRPEVKAQRAATPAAQIAAPQPARAPAPAPAASAPAARAMPAAAMAAPKPAIRQPMATPAAAQPAAAVAGRAARATVPPLAAPPIPQEAVALLPQAPVPAAPQPSYAGAGISQQQMQQAAVRQPARAPAQPRAPQQAAQPATAAPVLPAVPAHAPPAREVEVATAMGLQQSIARIHEACQAPPLSPPEYRVLFDAMALEIAEIGLTGAQTLSNVVQRAQAAGVEVGRDDVRFVLEVVSETDPWLEQGVSASLFAGRFRNFVVARCRSQGLDLSVEELDLIEAWFVAGAQQPAAATAVKQTGQYQTQPQFAGEQSRTLPAGMPPAASTRVQDAPGQSMSPIYAQPPAATLGGTQQAGIAGATEDEFPRIVRTRLRG